MLSVSVCMATWNGEAYLRPQIDSILCQLQGCDELIVSDDGSDDATLSILLSYGDRIKLVDSSRVGGVVPNFERALRYATRDVVLLSDQDDVWLPDRLEIFRERLRYASLLIANGDVVDSSLNSKGVDIFGLIGFRPGLFSNFVSNKYVGCCMGFRREVLDIALPFPAKLQWHDWYLGLICELFFRCEFYLKPTLLFRRHPHNASNTGRKSDASLLVKCLNRFWMFRGLCIVFLRRLRSTLFSV